MSRAKTRKLASWKRELCDQIFRSFAERVRAIFKRLAPAFFQRNPQVPRPCHTCALNRSTDDWPGFDATMLGLRKALEGNALFYCHEGTPWDRPGGWGPLPEELARMRLCSGYQVLRGDPAAAVAFQEAALDTMQERPELRRKLRPR